LKELHLWANHLSDKGRAALEEARQVKGGEFKLML